MSNFIVTILVIVVYFAPALFAFEKKNFASIFTLNLFLGWTFIGWVVALVWGLSKD